VTMSGSGARKDAGPILVRSSSRSSTEGPGKGEAPAPTPSMTDTGAAPEVPARPVSPSFRRLALDDPRWAAFVSSRPEATPFHQPAWAVFLSEAYNFDAFAIALERNDTLTDGIPVLEVRTLLGRRRWVSLPFTDECGPLGEAVAELTAAVDTARRSAGIGSHEVRASVPAGIAHPYAVSHSLTLGDDLESLMRSYRASVRQGIRVAAREGVVVRQATKQDLTHTFYGLHVATRRRLGVPVQRRRYFELLWDRVLASGNGFALIAEREGVALAAAVFLQSNGVVLYKYGASDARHWRLRANNALFHEAISRAVAGGARVFDWGRTDFDDEGLRRFKASWGSSEQELVYTTLGVESPATVGGGRAAALSRAVIRRSPSAVGRLAGALLYRYAG
jgi:Acetyltransferase (GNAT) domain